MPKATLEFTLPEESGEHQTAIDGSAWKQMEALRIFLSDLIEDSGLTIE